MGQRGQIDRLPVAHGGPIVALNWFSGTGDRENLPRPSSEGWVATGGLDRCVKVTQVRYRVKALNSIG